MIEKTGTIAELIFHNRETSYTVAVFHTEESENTPAEELTAVGYLPGAHKGGHYRLRGDFMTHRKYGEQFSFRQAEEIVPAGGENMVDFLASGILKGIGPKAAAAIVERFGENTLQIIEEQPARLKEVSGIGEKRAADIAASFRRHKEVAGVTLMLQQYGIDARYALKLYKVYGGDAVKVIKNEPYRLVQDLQGFGFRKADAIARKTGVRLEDSARIRCGIEYLLWQAASDGNTLYPRKAFEEVAAGMLEVSSEAVDENLYALAFTGSVKIEEIDGQDVVYLYVFYQAEQHVTACLRMLNSQDPHPAGMDVDSLIRAVQGRTGMVFSQEQVDAVRAAVRYGVTVITGGPGTGKTTIIHAILRVLEDGGLKTAVAAPTGRAARRITETTGHEASTIHRLLEYNYIEGEENMSFGKNEEDPLDYDAVIIDEASMVDLMLMNALVSAIPPRCRLILVGDADQLPSVGAGNVLRDILDSEVIHAVRLETIFRQAQESLIVINAHRINRGEMPCCNDREKDFFMMRRDTQAAMVETIISLCRDRLPRHYTALNALRDIQVLTPVRKGAVGTGELNKRLQQALNPPGEGKAERRFGETLFREGDKVMQIRNNYELAWRRTGSSGEGHGVFNGDMGYIETIDNEYDTMTVVFDEEKYVRYDSTTFDELEPAYAVTVHKSQGSEFPAVIMPMAWFPPMLATRNLLYTAVTRGRKLVVLVGSDKQLQVMVENNRSRERYSGLSQRLRNAL